MNFRYLLPCPELKEYVDYYIVMESSHDDGHLPVTVYPTPQAEMVFNYHGRTTEQVGSDTAKESNRWAISGFFTKKTAYIPEGPLGVIMVGFKPWGIQPFINFHTEEITNTNLDLKLVYPKETRMVEERLMEAASTLERIRIIETFLLSVLREKPSDLLVIGSIHSILEKKGIVNVGNLSQNFYLSEKQFVRRFRSVTGVTPKFFSRLVRFQHILKLMDSGRLDLLGYAVESGFYDLPHFIHEFAEFTGASPLAYIKTKMRTGLGIYFDSHIEHSPFYHRIYQ